MWKSVCKRKKENVLVLTPVLFAVEVGHRSTHIGLVPDCMLGKAICHNSFFWQGDITKSALSAILIIAQINEGRELVSMQCQRDVTN